MNVDILRIGNKVHNNQGKIETVTGLNRNNVFVNIGSYAVKDVYPVPLTKDILLKCGFTHHPDDEYPDDDKEEFLSLKVNGVTFESDYSDNFQIVTMRVQKSKLEIRALHQLQNKHFELTDQELNFDQIK